MSELYTADEVAAMLKVKKSTVLKWHREGTIKSVVLAPKIIRFSLEAIEAFKAAS